MFNIGPVLKMACLVLPSETARLVYGYLVKEKLDNIALQFLENSPYLTDCCHIVKSGYQFNTKFHYKELHELIQEYSTIQNIVNKKISLISRTSSLYKSIKLQCENLSEMIDLILFWRYDESMYEEDKSDGCKSKTVHQLTESKTDKTSIKTVNNNNNGLSQDSECNEYVSSSTPRNDKVRGENEAEVFEVSDCQMSDKYSDYKSDSNQTDGNMNCVVENVEERNRVNNEIPVNCNTMQCQKESNVCEIGKENSDMNISLDNMNQNNSNKSDKVEISLIPNEPDVVNIDGQIKIVRIEKDNHESEKNQLPNAFVENLDGIESGLNVENGSIFYVTPDGGNITINQDRNQIIVIPIDYYKTQTPCQNGGNGVEQPQNQNMTEVSGNCIGTSNGLIFEDVSVPSSSAPVSSSVVPFTSSTEKSPFVDENIVTESTFLKNKSLLYEIENKVKPQIFREPTPIKVSVPPPAPVQTIFVSQLIEQPDTRNRRILPKRDSSVQNTPIVVVQPLLEKNRVVKTSKPKLKPKKSSKKKITKCSTVIKTNVVEKEVTEVTEVLSMPNIRTPCPDRDPKEEEEKSTEKVVQVVENSETSEKINEEKENFGEREKKTETPVIIVNKNSKRLSLSTPRRKSHIRALEFETPPKSSNEKKKSRTSPKVKVEEMKIKNKNVRNTLFKSPDLETVFKTPSCLKNDEKTSPGMENVGNDSLNVTPTLPITTTSLNVRPECSKTELVDGVQPIDKKTLPKKSWDADLRNLISSEITTSDNYEKKRSKKLKKGQKSDKKSTKKKSQSPEKNKIAQIMSSPSKISLTAKRNTYSISGNEESSPVRSLLEELDLVTPFKDSEPARSVEETPITKFFRENVNGLDIDLNMINTPIFPPTPSIIITPDCDDSLSMAGTYYYTPLKDSGKERVPKVEVKNEEEIKVAETEKIRKKGTKESQEKVIGELVSKAKEIIGLKNDSEEHSVKKPLSGKVLSMVKIQMITQCDKKLYENIPINEEPVEESKEGTLIEKISEEAAKFDLKCELEEKRQRALRKIKSVKENLAQQTKKKKMKRSPVKRKITDELTRAKKRVKRLSGNDFSMSDEKDSSGSIQKEVEIHHSTPNEIKGSQSDLLEKVDRSMLEEIREEFPSFQDDSEFSELPIKTRKKLHYIKHFLKSEEILQFLENDKKTKKLKLKRSHRKFFQVFYKWLRHPHAHEVNISERTKSVFKEYRTLFEKIKTGVSLKISEEDSEKHLTGSNCIHNQFSDDEHEIKHKMNSKKKEDDADEGPVSALPLKKRKATVQPLQVCEAESSEKTKENPSRTQTLLQDIDVDRFLSQIHGQENSRWLYYWVKMLRGYHRRKK